MSKATAIVTGGSTGIGLEIAKQLLDSGFRVLNLSRRACEFKHPELVDIAIDLADRQATEHCCQQISANYDVSVLVHNAGVIRAAELEQVSPEDFDYLNQLHLISTTLLAQAVIPAMKEKRFGRIILMSSRASVGMKMRTAYSATKSGMIAMARTWALELGEFGITVNTVAPGPIASTEMFDSNTTEQQRAQFAQAIPVKRLGQPEDVARAVLFLADEKNGFITGQNLFVCGGASIGSI